jgi:hypothetical protein
VIERTLHVDHILPNASASLTRGKLCEGWAIPSIFRQSLYINYDGFLQMQNDVFASLQDLRKDDPGVQKMLLDRG